MRARDRSVHVGRNGRARRYRSRSMPPKPRPHGKHKPRASAVPKAPGTTGGRDNRLIAMLALGGVALLAVIGIGAALAFGGGDDGSDARTALEAAGCTLTVKPAVSNVGDHSDFPDPGARSPKWNTDPPTSGPHYGADHHLRRLQRAAADRPARPQPRARCHLHPLRRRGPGRDRAAASGFLRRPYEGDDPRALSKAWRADRARCLVRSRARRSQERTR